MRGRNAAEREWRIAVGDHAAATSARREFGEYLRSLTWQRADFTGAELVFGELVHNAVRHARSTVVVALVLGDRTRLRVQDDGPCFWIENASAPQPQAESGRGLTIVRSFAGELNVERLSPCGCIVSAVLPLVPAAARSQATRNLAGNGMR